MANYDVNIDIALKGAEKLTKFNKQVKTTDTQIEGFNQTLKNIAKDQGLFVRNFDNLNDVLKRATKNFNNATTGSQKQFAAARQLIAAEKELNKEYQERERVLQSITLKGQRSSILPGESLFGQSVTPKGGASGRSRQILQEEQGLQEALGAMQRRATTLIQDAMGIFPEDLPIPVSGSGYIDEKRLMGQSVNIEERLQQALANNTKKAEIEITKALQAAKRLRIELTEGDKIVNKLFSTNRTLNFVNSISKINSHVNLVTKSFNDATSAAERQRSATALIALNLKKMRTEATAFAQASKNAQALGDGAGNVKARLKEIKQFPKTILAGNKAMNILNGMLELAEVNSKDFLNISKAIGEQLRQNAEIQKKADKFIPSAIEQQDKDDESKKAIQTQIANIKQRILESTINQSAKDKLINDLNKSNLESKNNQLKVARQINIETQKNLTMEEKKQRRRGKITSSALIGGGFPLLFGGGPLQAIGGALGGGIGEAITPGGGFAGSIAATAAIRQIQQVVTGIANLGKAMGSFTQDTNALVNAMGFAGTAEGARIKIIEQLEGKQAAFNAAMQKMNETVGTEATKRLKDFGEKASLVGSEFKILMAQIQASLIPVINLVDRLFGISANAQRAQRERTIKNSQDVNIRLRTDEIEELKGQTGGGRTAVKNRNDRIKVLERELKLRAEVEIIETNIQTKADELTLEFAQHVKKIEEKAALEKEVANLMAGGMKKSIAEQIAQNNVLADQARKRLEIELLILKAKIADPDTEGKEFTNAITAYNGIKKAIQDLNIDQDKANKLIEEYGKKTDKNVLKAQKQELNILPLKQALEIEEKKLFLSSDELNILKAKNNLKKAEETLDLSLEELKISSETLDKEELDNLNEKINKEKILFDTAEATLKNAKATQKINKMKNQAALVDLDRQIELEQQRLTLLPKEIQLLQQKNKLSSLESALDIAKAANKKDLIASLERQIEFQNILINQSEILANPIKAEMIMLDKQMKQLNDVGTQVVALSKTIGSSFQESFKGVIMGTMSVTDAFRNMTNRIAEYFLDMAAQMMATQISKGFLSLFNPFNFGNDIQGPAPLFSDVEYVAKGGPVKGGNSYIVGERGPELFVPNLSGTIVPNHKIKSETNIVPNHEIKSETNIVVNVDASGSNVEGDDQSSRQLGELIAAAVQSEIVRQQMQGGLLS